MTGRPFRFSADPDVIGDLRTRLKVARPALAAEDPHGHLGIPPADLARLSAALMAMDWQGFADRVNTFPAFMLEQGDLDLHFVHQVSAEKDAIPLLLLHGWPGSFLEFREVIPHLIEGTPAFHVVCPSLPGFGFSKRPMNALWNARAMAKAMTALMRSLGYDRFVVQGGDWGSIIASEIARHHPENCLGLHLNLVAVQPPPEGDPSRTAVLDDEAPWLEENAALGAEGMGYYAIQTTRPQSLAVGLSDSPLGLLAWIGEKHLAWSDRNPSGGSLMSDQAIVDHVALYWATNSIGSSIRIYYDEMRDPTRQAYISIPTGVAVLPKETWKPPKAWAEHHFNLVHWTRFPRGGHFAALEVPELLASDIKAFVERLA
ncbi:epoxide hydrolase [Sphingomonas sp. KC8]|uniref:epoxide hydrolase n=1 Tax=Sphingomonas sp. KC8 TaxID=1030157 RepID=UPI0002488688|nr:epoxide hydrolase [Sphingomonas sp. KC8]ARS28735.1 epoxide hydratase [Sphingomonas sp. KC8]